VDHPLLTQFALQQQSLEAGKCVHINIDIHACVKKLVYRISLINLIVHGHPRPIQTFPYSPDILPFAEPCRLSSSGSSLAPRPYSNFFSKGLSSNHHVVFSSGIGRELALAALRRGDKVVATTRARSLDALESLKKQGADTLELDVTAPLSDLKDIADKAWKIHGRVDVVVNNAGFMVFGSLEELT